MGIFAVGVQYFVGDFCGGLSAVGDLTKNPKIDSSS